nr:hypothetical protein [Sicyoidochytrium minutum DNA virus]
MSMLTIAIFTAMFASYQICWTLHEILVFLVKYFECRGSYLKNRIPYRTSPRALFAQNHMLRSSYVANLISFLHALVLCEMTAYIYLGEFIMPFTPGVFSMSLLTDFDTDKCIAPTHHLDVNIMCSMSAGYFIYDAVRIATIDSLGFDWDRVSPHDREYLFHHALAFILVFIGAITPSSIWFAPMIPFFLFMEASTIHLAGLSIILGLPQMPFARFIHKEDHYGNVLGGLLTVLFTIEFLTIRVIIYWSKVVTFFARHAAQEMTLNACLILLCVVLPVGVMQLIWGSRILNFAYKKMTKAAIAFREFSHNTLGTRLDRQLASE